MERGKVIVIGAGAVGGATALALAERGYRVDVVDAAAQVASGASHANGAQLSYSYTDAMASPALLKKIPALLAMADPAFRYHPRLDRDHLRWGLSFLNNCDQAVADRTTLNVLRLALQSRETMHDWIARHGIDFRHRAAGKLHLYATEAELTAAAGQVALKNRLDIGQEVLTRDQAIRLEPALRHYRAPFAGAVYSPLDEVGDPAAFTRGAVQRAVALGGGALHLNTRVQEFLFHKDDVIGVRTDKGDLLADTLIVAAGWQTPRLVGEIDQPPLIAPMTGYSFTYDATEFSPDISLTDVSAKTVLCRLGDQVRMAGIADLGLVTERPKEKRLAAFKASMKNRFPKAARYDAESGNPWMGVRPMSPDSQPVIRATRFPNVILNCGQGMLGWTLAAGCARRVVSAMASNRQTAMTIAGS